MKVIKYIILYLVPVQNFQQVTVPVRVPVPLVKKLRFRFRFWFHNAAHQTLASDTENRKVVQDRSYLLLVYVDPLLDFTAQLHPIHPKHPPPPKH
jgi:hypothetical protein